jgi:hypothetical protein
MANTFKFGNGEWAVGKETALAYNDENSNFKPLPFTFDRASTATVVNKDGLIETVGTDEPRIDFKDNSKGALLLEPSRTNLIISSNNLTSQWGGYAFSGGNMSVSYGFLSPDGSNNATRLTYTNTSAGTGGALLTQNLNLIANAVYTISFWAKNVSGQKRIRLDLRNSSSAGVSGTSFELTDKWQKYSHTVTNENATNRGVQIRIIDSEFAGNRVFDMWGVQLEQASFATSTIPTSGSTATRSAESCSQTPPDGVIGQTEGVLYFESKINAQGTYTGITLSDGGTNNEIIIRFTTTDRIEYYLRSGGTQPIGGGTTLFDTDEYVKVAFAYKSGDSAVYINGNQVTTSTTTTMPVSLTKIKMSRGNGTGVFDGKVKNLRVYNTRLTNTELQALTTI